MSKQLAVAHHNHKKMIDRVVTKKIFLGWSAKYLRMLGENDYSGYHTVAYFISTV